MKTAFVFSGQGAQYVPMGKELYQHYSCCKAIFDTADKVLDFSLTGLCFGSDLAKGQYPGLAPDINDTAYTQPALLTLSMAAYQLLKESGVTADYMAGFSLGEYSALTAAGVFSLEDALWLVRQRGIYMTEAFPPGDGAMSAIMGLDGPVVESACREISDTAAGVVMPANYNMPGQIVIAGHRGAVEEAETVLKERGAKRAVRLNVSGPFHTPLMAPASERLGRAIDKINYHEPQIPVISNLTAAPYNPGKIKETLLQQVMQPVLWAQSIENLVGLGVTTFIELGPGKTLCNFIRKIDRDVSVYHIEDVKSYEKTLAGIKAGRA